MARPSSSARSSRPAFGGAVAALLCALGLWLGSGLAPSLAWAPSGDALTPTAIAAFEQKLSAARAAQAGVSDRVACFEREDRRLVQERDAHQKRLGGLVGHRKQLEATLAQQRAEYQGFSQDFEETSARLQELNDQLRQAHAYRAAKEQAFQECRSRMGFMSFLCDFSQVLSEALGLIRNNEHDIEVQERRVALAASGRDAAEQRYRASQAALAASETDAAETAGQIKVAETSIVSLQQALATLRPMIHENKVVLDAFADALNEARTVDTADGRDKTARQVLALAGQVDEVSQTSDTLSAKARSLLSEEQLKACFP